MHIHMPACWDGVVSISSPVSNSTAQSLYQTFHSQNLDSPDHISHTAYLSDLDRGSCPSTHPVPLMKLLYEVIGFDLATRCSIPSEFLAF